MAKKLMKGNEAIGEAAIQAGCKHYFAYPITPQNEVGEYMARRLPEIGGLFVQAESELGASNMLFGAAATGTRVFTSSSGPGISLMSEAFSYMAGAHLPVVIVDIVRAGPGLGGILPSQSDYFQVTKGGGHGDYHMVVLAPSSVQEAATLTMTGFDIADFYKTPVLILGDGMVGQMMEPVEFTLPEKRSLPPKDWATTGCKGDRKPNIVRSLHLDPYKLEQNNLELQKKYKEIIKNEIKYESYNTETNYDVLVVSYGMMARICKTVIDSLKTQGINIGLIRPITLWPFPYEAVEKASDKAKKVVSIEMSYGQMLEDVQLAVKAKKPVSFFGRAGGIVPSVEEVTNELKRLVG